MKIVEQYIVKRGGEFMLAVKTECGRYFLEIYYSSDNVFVKKFEEVAYDDILLG